MFKKTAMKFSTIITILLLTVSSLHAKVNDTQWLVKIGNKTFTVKDFRNWWDNYKVDGSKFPKNPTPFIDWMLLFQNGTELGLYKLPSYQQKIRQFVKVRSLLLLQGDTLAPAKKVTDKEVYEYYSKNFIPIEKFRVFFFNTKEDAEKAKKLLEKGATEDEIAKTFGIKDKNRFIVTTSWMRPFEIKDKNQRKLLFGSPKGTVVGPFKDRDKWKIAVILEKVEKEANEKKNLKVAKEKLIKEREAELTAEFIEKLKKKYPVYINEKLLKEITPDNFPESKKNEIVLKVGNYALTAGAFIKFLNKELDWLKHSRFEKYNLETIKRRVVNSIISQTLVGIEATNRHYEKKEPLKSMFEFYCQNRIIKELENRVIRPSVKVTDKDIEDYYKAHLNEYKLPDKVKFRFLQTTDKKLADKLWKKIESGANFTALTKEIMGYDNVVEVPYKKLLPETKKIVDSLKKGEISKPFTIKDTYFIVQLIDIHKGEYKPLKEVKEDIRKILEKEKFQKAKENYIKKLYMNLLTKGKEVKVNWDVWNQLVAEYTHKEEFNGNKAFYVFLGILCLIFLITYIKTEEQAK